MEKLPIEMLPTEPRDLAMGEFMNAWSELEAQLRSMLSALAGTQIEISIAIGAAIPDNGRMKELLLVLGDIQLRGDADRAELAGICEHLSIANAYRNSIVHGQWLVRNNREATGPGAHPYEWVRVYSIIGRSKEMAAVFGTDETSEKRWVFTIKRLTERAASAAGLADRIRRFQKGIRARVRHPERTS